MTVVQFSPFSGKGKKEKSLKNSVNHSFPFASILYLFHLLIFLPLGREGEPCWRFGGGQHGEVVKKSYIFLPQEISCSLGFLPLSNKHTEAVTSVLYSGPSPTRGKFSGVGQ